jgi:hypothetical protein
MLVNSGLHVPPGLPLEKTIPGTYWVGPKAGLEAAEEKISGPEVRRPLIMATLRVQGFNRYPYSTSMHNGDIYAVHTYFRHRRFSVE